METVQAWREFDREGGLGKVEGGGAVGGWKRDWVMGWGRVAESMLNVSLPFLSLYLYLWNLEEPTKIK